MRRENDGHNQDGFGRSKEKGGQNAAQQMPGRSPDDRKIDHLGDEEKSRGQPHQGDLAGRQRGFDVPQGRRDSGRGKDRGGDDRLGVQKTVRDMHRQSEFRLQRKADIAAGGGKAEALLIRCAKDVPYVEPGVQPPAQGRPGLEIEADIAVLRPYPQIGIIKDVVVVDDLLAGNGLGEEGEGGGGKGECWGLGTGGWVIRG